MPESESQRRWRQGIGDELGYWRAALADPASEIRGRFDPRRAFRDPEAVRHLARDGHLRVLDVGAGPVTNLGYVHPDALVHITAIDALADEFQALLQELGLQPPVVTLALAAEELDRAIPAQSYDAVYCTNALDHCYDPLRAMANMLRAVRSGGVVSMLHFVDEGSHEGHRGLHQWNLRVEDGRALLAGPAADPPIDLLARFAAVATPLELRCWDQDADGRQRRCFTLRLCRTTAQLRPEPGTGEGHAGSVISP